MPPAPKATELASVPVKVRVLLAVRVFPFAIVKVAEVAGAVNATLFIEVAVATPMIGVIKVGESSTTNFVPVPVCEAIEVALPTLVITPVRLALVVTVAAFPVILIPAVPAEIFAAVRLVRFAPETAPNEALQVPDAMVPTVVIFPVPAQVLRAVFSTLSRLSVVLCAVALTPAIKALPAAVHEISSPAPAPAVCLPKRISVAEAANLPLVIMLFAKAPIANCPKASVTPERASTYPSVPAAMSVVLAVAFVALPTTESAAL